MGQARRINADGRDGQPRPTLFNHSLPADELHPLRAILQPLAQHIQQSLHYWDWFTQSENITSWRTVSLQDLYDFAEAMANIYLEYQDTATFTDAGYWAVPTPWADSVPFVNRPFESEIHGTVNFTYFCCVLLVTWCYRVLLSCYLRPK